MTLFLVGDPDQTLYRFQGAKPELITNGISKWLPEIETIKLEINYRSTNEIIAKSQRLISHNYSGLGGPYPQEFMKNSSGIKGQGKAVTFEMYETAEHEALETANNINELLSKTECADCNGKGHRYATENDRIEEGREDWEIDCESCKGLGYYQGYKSGDFFIGARTRAQLGFLEGALVKAKIPFINIAGGSFWQSKHVADVVAYLRLANNTNDKDALGRVYNIASKDHKYGWSDKCKKCKGNKKAKGSCRECKGSGLSGIFEMGDYCNFRGLGKEFLIQINYNFNNIDKVLFGEGGWRYKTKDKLYPRLGPTKAQDLQEFVWMLKSAVDRADNAGQVIQVIIDDCYEKYLKSKGVGDDAGSNAKIEDLQTIQEIASEYASIDKFLAYVDEMAEVAQRAKDKDWKDYVVISTIHRLKGLERKVVFGIGWCEGVCIKSSRDVGLLPHTFSLSSPPSFGVLPGGGMSPMEDERDCGFVLISRAIERCYLSGIKSYRSYNLVPSRFIYEMGLLDEKQN